MSRLSHLSDNEIKVALDKIVKLTKEYGEVVNSLTNLYIPMYNVLNDKALIYDADDFIRVVSILGSDVENLKATECKSELQGIYYQSSFKYEGCEFVNYTSTVEESEEIIKWVQRLL